MRWLVRLDSDAADHAAIGGKARSLARLAAAGLSAPSAFVVGDALFRAIAVADLPGRIDQEALSVLHSAAAALRSAHAPRGFAEELSTELARIGAERWAVRSSCGAEDDPSGLAAGVFASVVNVSTADVATAIRIVLASALGAGAAAYALAHGRAVAAPPVAVLVHPYVAGTAMGLAAAAPGSEATLQVTRGTLTAKARAALEAALTTVVARHGPSEVEWVSEGDALTFLQLRPFRPKPSARPWSGFAELPPPRLASSAPRGAPAAPAPQGRAWRWDAAHNPLPLSPAQAGLVALVEAQGVPGLQQAVAGGYLFYVADPSAPLSLSPAEARPAFDALASEVERALGSLGHAPPLEPALATFAAATVRLFGAIAPAARRARSLLDDLLRLNLPDARELVPALLADVPSIAQERRRLAAAIARASDPDVRKGAIASYLARFGDESPAWDVAVPTYAEAPASLEVCTRSAAPPGAPSPEAPAWQRAQAEILARLPRMARRAWKDAVPLARDAVALGEDDDHLFARLQATVRRALLALGGRLVAAGELDAAADVFFLPLDRIRALASASPSPPGGPASDLRELVRAARALWAIQREAPPPAPADVEGPVRGHGTGGRAIGRVVHAGEILTARASDPAAPPAAGQALVASAMTDAVLVATTILPTLLPLLAPAALVVETGGPLDHVAAQARERGLPAVVGAAGAPRRLPPGTLVLVDADAGVVIPLAHPSARV
jgi:pyruvate,water dikinase